MLDLSKRELPESINVNGSSFAIRTDFRYFLNFERILNNEKFSLDDFDFVYKNRIPKDKEAGFKALMDFYAPKNILPRATGSKSEVKAFDYLIDADLIYAAFYQQYKIDLFEVNLHWWKFTALLMGLKDTKFTDVIGYRFFDKNDKTSYEVSMEKARQSWELPTPQTKKDQQDLESFNRLFEKKN